MSPYPQQQIMADLAGILSNFHGREYGGEITAETMFSADLGLASIDAVVLGETLEQHYDQKIPFEPFLAELGRSGARDLRLGVLAEFLEKNLE